MITGIIYNQPLKNGFNENRPRSSKPGLRGNICCKSSPYAFSTISDVFSAQNKAFINFKSYNGDRHPLKKLFGKSTYRSDVYEDNWTWQHLYQAGDKKWVNASPNELLRYRNTEQTIQSICTLTKPLNGFPRIPDYIPSPSIGENPDKWGIHANYIELNPRITAKYENGRVSEGILGALKLLPAIPPSPRNFANCVILSQLYPGIDGDGRTGNHSLYTANIPDDVDNYADGKISKNLTIPGLHGKMGEDEQIAAFNQAAHLLGLKTGIRMPLYSDQLRVNGRGFNWWHDKDNYIKACRWAVELGFDAIYFDSAKHIVKKEGYPTYGELPTYQMMQEITKAIRDQTGRKDIAFIGEKCDDDWNFKNIGLTAGTDWGKADDYGSVLHEARKQRRNWNSEYKTGPEVSNDNYGGGMSYEQRLHRIKSCLYGYDNIHDKLPTYMQINDIFPLNNYTNTHELMMGTRQTSGSDAWTEWERHWDGCFERGGDARDYTQRVYHEFKHVMNR